MFRRITQFMRYQTGPGNLKLADHVVLAKPQDFEAVTATSEKNERPSTKRQLQRQTHRFQIHIYCIIAMAKFRAPGIVKSTIRTRPHHVPRLQPWIALRVFQTGSVAEDASTSKAPLSPSQPPVDAVISSLPKSEEEDLSALSSKRRSKNRRSPLFALHRTGSRHFSLHTRFPNLIVSADNLFKKVPILTLSVPERSTRKIGQVPDIKPFLVCESRPTDCRQPSSCSDIGHPEFRPLARPQFWIHSKVASEIDRKNQLRICGSL
jgi:hypothetical protein